MMSEVQGQRPHSLLAEAGFQQLLGFIAFGPMKQHLHSRLWKEAWVCWK